MPYSSIIFFTLSISPSPHIQICIKVREYKFYPVLAPILVSEIILGHTRHSSFGIESGATHQNVCHIQIFSLNFKDFLPFIIFRPESLAKYSGKTTAYIRHRKDKQHHQWYIQRKQPVQFIRKKIKLNQIRLQTQTTDKHYHLSSPFPRINPPETFSVATSPEIIHDSDKKRQRNDLPRSNRHIFLCRKLDGIECEKTQQHQDKIRQSCLYLACPLLYFHSHPCPHKHHGKIGNPSKRCRNAINASFTGLIFIWEETVSNQRQPDCHHQYPFYLSYAIAPDGKQQYIVDHNGNDKFTPPIFTIVNLSNVSYSKTIATAKQAKTEG